MELSYIAYFLLFVGLSLKTFSLYCLSNKKEDLEVRKKKYMRFNIPSYFFIVGGVLILVYEWYL